MFKSHLKKTVLLLTVMASFGSFSQSGQRVEQLQETVLTIYDELLGLTVRVEVGSSGASAVVVSEDGYLLTAAHVIDAVGGEDVEVRLHDGSVYTAQCLGKSELGDYGLMKIEPKRKLAYAKLGTASDLVKDDACLMFGHPSTSEKDRPAIGRIGFYKGKTFDGYLKTTCIMMPGDSGGPLFNLKGELIGVCSYINENYEMNFYPSIDNVKKNWDKLIAGEIFEVGESRFNFFTTDAPEKQGPYVLKGGKRALLEKLKFKSAAYESAVVSLESKVDDRRNKTYGTIYDDKGYIIAKSSEVGEVDVSCTLDNGETYAVQIIGRDVPNDLAILQIKPKRKLNFIDLKNNAPLEVGQFVTTVIPNENNVLVGILGLGTRNITTKDTGFLGIGFAQNNELAVADIEPNGPAARYGLQNGDIIISYEGNNIQKRSDFVKFLPDTRPNQKVIIGVLRNGEKKNVEVILGKRGETSNHARVIATNKIRDGFPNAFTHDIPIKPNQCGTPVVNLNGDVIGINIARRNRTCTLAIPLEKVNEVVRKIHL